MIYLLLYTFSFLAIGLWLGLRLLRYRLFPIVFLYVCSIAASLLVLYAIFYIYLANPEWGHDLTIAYIAYGPLALLSIIRTAHRSPRDFKLILHCFLPPLLIISMVFIGYSSLLYGCRYAVPSFDDRRPANNTFCSLRNMPLDNGLPEMFGADILIHEPKNTVLDWTIADRPPLQIAATIPIQDLDRTASPHRISSYYNMFSVFLQLSWIGAVWALFRRLKISRRYQTVLFIGFCATGFFYLNSIFVWPKLLAGALTLAGMSPFIGRTLTGKRLRYLPVAGALISLGLMSHGGVVFSVIPFGCLMVYKLWFVKKRDWRIIAAAFVVAFTIYAPWQIYKSSITPSDRLIKYQLADVPSAADKRGTWQTVADAYKSISFNQWAHNKAQNVKTLIDGTGNEGFMYICPVTHVVASRDQCQKQRDLTFFSTLFAVENFVIGLAFFMYQAVRRRLDGFDKESAIIIGGTLLVWVLLMFAPGSTVVHQGSYVTNILMFVVLGRSILRSSPRFLLFVVAAQLAVFYVVWIRAFPYFS